MMNRTGLCALIILLGGPGIALGQPGPDTQKILNRLDQLEEQNRKLLDEIHQLRKELAGTRSAGTAEKNEERLEVQERRTDDLAQSKVESSQRMPLAITGMLLFNAYDNAGFGGSSPNPVVAGRTRLPVSAGGTLEQTVLGLKFYGPDLPGGGKASGSLYMDFFGTSASPGVIRLRTATLDLAWKNTTLTFGQDKPIFAPREPDSLAQVAVSPLTAAGNLWDWQPQVRVEQRFQVSENTGFRAQLGVYETAESIATVPTEYARTLGQNRPALEGRLEFGHGSEHRLEIAPGFHVSQTHVAGMSVPSRIVSLDGMFKPASFMQLTGAWFQGENVANTGALRNSFTILSSSEVIPVHASGGWGQVAIFPLPRLSFHFYAGAQRNREADLGGAGIHQNLIYAGNVMYRLGPNILASFEASQVRSSYLTAGDRLSNHYDLAMAYLF